MNTIRMIICSITLSTRFVGLCIVHLVIFIVTIAIHLFVTPLSEQCLLVLDELPCQNVAAGRMTPVIVREATGSVVTLSRVLSRANGLLSRIINRSLDCVV